ncbi:helix-turn-helix domain-containing protein [Aeromicrobium yanjiei]|nr:helix-turn-helix domain-containing protein [Aeromicrobium yanjiei]
MPPGTIPVRLASHVAKPSGARSLSDWSQEVWNVYGALEVVVPNDQPFGATLDKHSFDKLDTVELRTSPQTVRRTDSMVKTHPVDSLVVSLFVEGQGLIVQDGRSCSLAAGDFAFIDSRRPYSMVLETEARVIDFIWPRELLGLTDAECLAATGRPVPGASPMGRWLSPALVGLHEMRDGVSSAGAGRIVGSVSDLLVTAALELAEPDEVGDRWRGQFEQVIKFVERNLDCSDFGVDQIAEEFFMSKRTVHRLFARFDTTVACAVRDMRLELARQRMLSPAYRSQSVSFIASQLGFSSLQVFSRAFTAKFGVGPKGYRDAHA